MISASPLRFVCSGIECHLNGPVLELEFANGSQIVINRHAPNREIWLAAKSGGFHYAFQDGQWVSRRDGGSCLGSWPSW